MNILYCGDRNICDGVLISVLSLLKNVKENLNIYILTVGFKGEDRECLPVKGEFVKALEALVKSVDPKNTVTLIDARQQFNSVIPTANLKTRFTPCCMLRLYADIIPQLPDRILYLDNDVICRGDFSEFYFQDMDKYELAGVLDHYGKHFFYNMPFKKEYLNSGVLLLNLEKIRETGLFEKCRERCRVRKMFMPDQSAINKLSRYKKIEDRKFNEQRKLQNDTVFQHFTTSFRFVPIFRKISVKPWQIEKVHSVLKLYEYDDIPAEYKKLKEKSYANK